MRMKKLIGLVAYIVIIVVMLEVLLRLVDPLGVHTYYQWLKFSFNERTTHPTGYTFNDGDYVIAGHEVTIENTNRILPVRPDATCTIAFIGDSVTFGVGVGDSETFAWGIAELYPDVQFVNTGRGGYDSWDLSNSIQYWEADAYMYLIVANDVTEGYMPSAYEHLPTRLALHNYIAWFNYTYVPSDISNGNNLSAYGDMLDVMDSYPVLYTSYNRHLAFDVASERHEVILAEGMPIISRVDPHPTVEGHRRMASIFAPHVEDLIEEYCTEE